MASVPTASTRPLNPLDAPQNGVLSSNRIAILRKEFEGNPVYRMAQNAVCKITVDDIALDRRVLSDE